MRSETKKLPKIVVICGPTASGKTEWGLRLAKKFKGEIISADSRQVYTKMSIGVNKPKGVWCRDGLTKNFYFEDVLHHLVDFLNPGKRFTVAEFRDSATKTIKLINRKEKLPLVVGGTGMYISALVENWQIPRVPPNLKLRRSLSEKGTDELMQLLWSLDPAGASKIDKNNKLRVIRALEVCIFTGEPFSEKKQKGEPLFNVLQIGIDIPREILYDRINSRVDKMMSEGLLAEVKMLVKQRYGWSLPSMSGIGYKQFKPYFDGVASLEQVVEKLKRDTRQYGRRQLTWFRADKKIKWLQNCDQAVMEVEKFLKY